MRGQMRVEVRSSTDFKRLLLIADKVEALRRASRALDVEIFCALQGIPQDQVFIAHKGVQRPIIGAAPYITSSVDILRYLGGLLVYASDTGADGLAMVKLVFNTKESPIVEHTGIALHLQHAWLAAAIRGVCYGKT